MAGERRVLLITGEPGIGKTRLATELAREVHEEGATVLLGRSEEELDVPYRPFVEALTPLVLHADADILASHAAEHGDRLAGIIPALRRRMPAAAPVPHEDPQVARFRLFQAVADLLVRAAERAPVMLVLDDLHWADKGSLLLLTHLTSTVTNSRLLVLGTYRDTDVSRTHPLSTVLADLRRHPGTHRIALAGLNAEETDAFLEAAAGHDLTATGRELSRAVQAETQGNPFFIGEVLSHLVEAGAILRREDRWETDADAVRKLGVPEGVREVIGRRLSALDDEANGTLRVAAVIGLDFSVKVLADVLELSTDVTLDYLEEAFDRRLIVESPTRPGVYRFAHALVRQTLLEELRTPTRIRLHHRIARVLAATRRASPSELAHHFGEAAVIGPVEEAISYALQASAAAVSGMAYEEGIEWVRRAVELDNLRDGDPGRRAELLATLGEAHIACSDMEGACRPFVEAADLARQAGRHDVLLRCALGYAFPLGVAMDPTDTDGPAMLVDAEAVLDPEDSAERAEILARRSSWLGWTPNHAEQDRLSAEALTIARRVGPESLVTALYYRFEAVRLAAWPDEWTAVVDEWESMARLTTDHRVLGRALQARAWIAAARGDVETLNRVRQETADLYERYQYPPHLIRLHLRDASAAVLQNDASGLERAADGLLGDASVGFRDNVRWAAALFSWRAAQLAGDAASEAVRLRELLEVSPARLGCSAVYRARLALLEGRDGDARRGVAEWKRSIDAVPSATRTRVAWLAGNVALDIDDDRAATMVEHMLAPWDGLWLDGAIHGRASDLLDRLRAA